MANIQIVKLTTGEDIIGDLSEQEIEEEPSRRYSKLVQYRTRTRLSKCGLWLRRASLKRYVVMIL